MNKLISIGIVVALLAAVGGYFYPLALAPQAGQSTAGSTFSTAKTALMVMAPSTSAATTTSILNTDTNDRMINGIEVTCGGLGQMLGSGTGVASFTLKMATTSSASSANGLQGNSNLVGATITISTSTPDIVISSSTPSIAGNVFAFDRWAAGTNLTTLLNSTSTAACTIGVRYIPT